MQTLWSRAAQSKCSCRCSSCLSAATAVTRHTTTATGRRRLKAGEAFTLFYSSIFATAALADAKIKENRRNEWDRVITEARGPLTSEGRNGTSIRPESGKIKVSKKGCYIQSPSSGAMPRKSSSKLLQSRKGCEIPGGYKRPVQRKPQGNQLSIIRKVAVKSKQDQQSEVLSDIISACRKCQGNHRNQFPDFSLKAPPLVIGDPSNFVCEAKKMLQTRAQGAVLSSSNDMNEVLARKGFCVQGRRLARTASAREIHQRSLAIVEAKGAIKARVRNRPDIRERNLSTNGFHVETHPRVTPFSPRIHQNRNRRNQSFWPFQHSAPRVEDQVLSPSSLETLGNHKYFRANNPTRPPLPPTSIRLSMEKRRQRPTALPSLKKLKTLECSVAKLVFRLILQAHANGETALAVPHPGTSEGTSIYHRSEVNRELRELEARLAILPTVPRGDEEQIEWFKKWDSPQYPRYTLPQVLPDPEEGRERNKAIRAVLQGNIRGDLDVKTMIDRICYNLLISNTPPNVDTYNLLIIYLCRSRQNEMVGMVLDSMFESHIRPNEVTISSTLKYLTVSRNRSGFNSFVRLMQGLDGGLFLAKPDTKITSASKGRLNRLPNGKVVQKPLYDPYIFGALIDGTLRLFGVAMAARRYRAMVRKGYLPNIVVVTSILRVCALTADWGVGGQIWQELSLAGHGDTLMTIEPDERAYFWMLRLCRQCNRDDEFAAIYEKATSLGFKPEAILFHPPTNAGTEVSQERKIQDLLVLERPGHPINQLSSRLARYTNDIGRLALEAIAIKRQMLIKSIESTLKDHEVCFHGIASAIASSTVRVKICMVDSILRDIEDQIRRSRSSIAARVNEVASALRHVEEEVHHILISRIMVKVEQTLHNGGIILRDAALGALEYELKQSCRKQTESFFHIYRRYCSSADLRGALEAEVKRTFSISKSLEGDVRFVATRRLNHDLVDALQKGGILLRRAASRTATFELKHFNRRQPDSFFETYRAYYRTTEKQKNLIPAKPDHLDTTSCEKALAQENDSLDLTVSNKAGEGTGTPLPLRVRYHISKDFTKTTPQTLYPPAATSLPFNGLFPSLPTNIPYSLERRQGVSDGECFA
ncbi:MAG: hypothetical protein M1835_001915 [Candelina submexicana]|nr:MAG: hypothetical protein M1835_001915 [Candelina submexicana]